MISVALHAGGVGAAIGCRTSGAHAEWRGEEPSVRWTVRVSSTPAIFVPPPPEAEATPSPAAMTSTSEPQPETEPPPTLLPTASEPAPPVPAPETFGTAGPELATAELREELARTPPPAVAPELEPQSTPTAPPLEPARAEPASPASPDAKDSTKVDASPLPGQNPTPPYPFVAWRRHIEGSVLISLRIDKTGAVIEGHVARSSGNTMLDDAALRTLKTWKFAPAHDALGVHECTHEREVVFRIRT
jgi:protein TonB